MKEFAWAVTDEKRRSLSLEVIENFETVVVPEYKDLLFGAIHGDLNEQNILGYFHSSSFFTNFQSSSIVLFVCVYVFIAWFIIEIDLTWNAVEDLKTPKNVNESLEIC